MSELADKLADWLDNEPMSKPPYHLIWDAVEALRAQQAKPVVDDAVISSELLEFLRGAGTLQGCSFGETPMTAQQEG
jgi:hypothetical protein